MTKLKLNKINWVIVGGESGRKPRPIKQEWVYEIFEKCEEAGVKFFFQQWGDTNRKKTGRLLNGRTYDEMPEIEVTF